MKKYFLFLVLSIIAAGAVDAKILCISHRGCRLTHPENTLVCFDHAATLPVDWIETDSWLSKDQVPMLHHDIDMCRTTNVGDWSGYDCSPGGEANNPLGRYPRVKDFTVAELKTLDCGSWFDPAFAGEPMPSLEEGLEAVQSTWQSGQVGVPLIVEIKDVGQAPIIREIMERRAFHPDSLIIWARIHEWNAFQNEMPGTRRIRGYYDPRDLTEQDLADIAAFGEFGIAAMSPWYTQEFVDLTKQYNLFLYSVAAATGGMNFYDQVALGVVGFHSQDPENFLSNRSWLQCVDGIDNDGDGDIDFDGLDRNLDWTVDVPADAECLNRLDRAEIPQCSDGRDNDADTYYDYPNDLGCVDALDIDESGPNAGEVPDGAGVPGQQLTVNRAGGDDIVIAWSASCSPGDSNYGVYEGVQGSWSSAAPVTCDTGGATSWSFTPSTGSRYYLVVPQAGNVEGLYGVDSSGVQRTGAARCYPQVSGACGNGI
ncbi:MAG: hypothetical protein IFK94_07715 [Acidobacteria bacterium]|uniref:GP-PDE domain-containing protein n=1 Tax=Candidatus Polarisedimenticola svalbardensis TaxID=2886004 RepID=A0A8J7C1N2_9BACT|nr:hypothetical protein [Candidatus Polarisedimenticola svalbardensis]